MNEKNSDSNSQDDSFSDSMELFDDIFDDGKQVNQKPAPQKESSVESPVSTSPDKITEKQPASDSQDGAFSDSMELFDDIFDEGTDADKPAPPSKKTPPPPPKKTRQAPESQKAQAMQTPRPPVTPPKKAPPVKPQPTTVTPDKTPSPPPPKKTRQAPESQKAQAMQTPRPPVTPPKKAPPVKPQPSAPTPDKTPSPPPVKKAQKVPEPQKGPPVPPSEKEPIVPLDLSAQKTSSRGKARKALNPLLFISSILVLVIVSVLTGMILDYGGVFDPLNITGYFEPDKKTTSRSKTSSPVTRHEEPEIEISNIQGPPATTEGTPPVISSASPENVPPEETVSLTETQEVRSVEDLSEEKEPPPLSAQPPPPKKPVPHRAELLEVETLSYPYSIYLGSYSSKASVEEAISDYEEMGISPYWVELDLGDKGIWFRLFAGYFQKRAEADEFIKTQQIPGAESKNTPYANLIGIYTSEKEFEIQKEALKGLGYSPYVISDTPNVYRLYTGAFYQKERAEEQVDKLSLRGIKSQVVDRR
jgi:hypothetical protein